MAQAYSSAIVVIHGVANEDGKPSYAMLDDATGAWDDVPGTTPVDALAAHFKMGFEIVAAIKTERGTGPLMGTWEIWLKRRLTRKTTGGTLP